MTNKFNIDYVRLEMAVREKARLYLDEITENSLQNFANAVKFEAKSVLENYYFCIDNFYTEGEYRIRDKETLNSFMDFHNGYRAQMKRWVSSNDIAITKISVDSVIPPKQPVINKSLPGIVAGVGSGTVAGAFIAAKSISAETLVNLGLSHSCIATGLAIFSNVWVLLAAELLVLGAAYCIKKKQKNTETKYKMELCEYEIAFEKSKAEFINGILFDLKKWLENAYNFSKDLLTKFNIV